MTTPRLYIPSSFSLGAVIQTDPPQAHYIASVMRRKTGDTLIVFNGVAGEWLAEIISVKRKTVCLQLKQQLRPQLSVPELWFVFAPLRNGKTEYLVEKATELGVSRLLPVLTRHTVVKTINLPRLETIAIEAAEQCERLDVPVMDALQPLERLLGDWDKDRTLIYGDESGAGKPAQELLSGYLPGSYAVLIGPEGGFAPAELEILQQLPLTAAMCMGPRILRADTAAVAALALVQSHLGDWAEKPHFNQGFSG